jgi:hypothetical protein
VIEEGLEWRGYAIARVLLWILVLLLERVIQLRVIGFLGIGSILGKNKFITNGLKLFIDPINNPFNLPNMLLKNLLIFLFLPITPRLLNINPIIHAQPKSQKINT